MDGSGQRWRHLGSSNQVVKATKLLKQPSNQVKVIWSDSDTSPEKGNPEAEVAITILYSEKWFIERPVPKLKDSILYYSTSTFSSRTLAVAPENSVFEVWRFLEKSASSCWVSHLKIRPLGHSRTLS